MAAYPCSGEINYTVSDAKAVLAHFAEQNSKVDSTDELSLELADWRKNVRASNTGSLLRLNIELRGNSDLLAENFAVIEQLIKFAV